MRMNDVQIKIIPAWAGLTVQDICKNKLHLPKKLLHQLRMDHAVKVNEEKVNWTYEMEVDDRLLFTLPEEANQTIVPQKFNLQVLYEDEHILMVNKPANVDVHPNGPNDTQTLVHFVTYYLQQKGDFRPIKVIHRLDRHTTGAIIFAKHVISEALFNKMIENQQITRKYVALTNGIFKKKEWMVNEAIGRDRHHPTRRRVSKSGQAAKTKFTVIQVFQKEQITFVECQLFTGRTHQIRVHLQYLGYPIVGDVLYGGGKKFSRPALHARHLAFTHPITNERIKITAPFTDQQPIFEHYIANT